MKLVEAIADDVMVVEAYGRLDSTTSKGYRRPIDRAAAERQWLARGRSEEYRLYQQRRVSRAAHRQPGRGRTGRQARALWRDRRSQAAIRHRRLHRRISDLSHAGRWHRQAAGLNGHVRRWRAGPVNSNPGEALCIRASGSRRGEAHGRPRNRKSPESWSTASTTFRRRSSPCSAASSMSAWCGFELIFPALVIQLAELPTEDSVNMLSLSLIALGVGRHPAVVAERAGRQPISVSAMP